MEEIQKLHITKIPTLDTPRRIVYQETTHTFGVITEKMTPEPYTSQSTTGGFELLDDQNFSCNDYKKIKIKIMTMIINTNHI